MVLVPVICCFGEMYLDFDLCLLYRQTRVVVFLIHCRWAHRNRWCLEWTD